MAYLPTLIFGGMKQEPHINTYISFRPKVLSRIWYPWSLWISFLWFTLSKALLKFSSMTSVCVPSFRFWWSSSMGIVNWVSQDFLAPKPCWKSKWILFHILHCLQMLQLFQTKKRSFFLYVMHCIHLSHFFDASSENICPIYSLVHSLSQSVSHLNSVFSFKIHCLQILQSFQTKKGSIVFIVTLVYSSYIVFPYIMHLLTLVTLFWCIIRTICLTK